MAENFDLIFGQSASSQYAWNDSDYQNGWETVGSTPPIAEQFDALQRRSDKKAQELNNALTPLVNANQTDNRQPSTAYSEGDIKYSPLLPTGWFLACTVSGTSSASGLVVPSPVEEGDEITDGGVTWKVKKIGGAGDAGDGVPLGAIIAYSANGDLPAGYLLCDGSAVSRTMFPDLFAKIGTTYGAGDGSTTFNVPDYNAAKRFAQGDAVAGTVKSAGLPNIEGHAELRQYVDAAGNDTVTNGSVTMKSTEGMPNALSVSGVGYGRNLCIDASLSSPIYGASSTVQPDALTCRYIIKAFDGQTPDSALIDVTQYAQELATKATRSLDNLTQAGQDSFLARDFTIIYPNGGTEANPANITNNSRYVEQNPFPGYYVFCSLEVLYDNKWGDPNTEGNLGTGQQTYGAAAYDFDGSIVIQTGTVAITARSSFQINPFGQTNDTPSTTLPCRVKVWKIGKIPTA